MAYTLFRIGGSYSQHAAEPVALWSKTSPKAVGALIGKCKLGISLCNESIRPSGYGLRLDDFSDIRLPLLNGAERKAVPC